MLIWRSVIRTHCKGFEHRPDLVSILGFLLDYSCDIVQVVQLSVENVSDHMWESSIHETYSAPFFRVGSSESTTSLVIVMETTIFVLVVISLDRTCSLLGKCVLLSNDSFFYASQILNDAACLAKGIVNFRQLRQDFRKVSCSRGLVSTLGPFTSEIMAVCRGFGNLEIVSAKFSRNAGRKTNFLQRHLSIKDLKMPLDRLAVGLAISTFSVEPLLLLELR